MLSQEEILNKQIKEEKKKCHYQLLLKTIIMMFLFYILTYPVIMKSVKEWVINHNSKIGKNLILTLIFGGFYYILHIIFI